MQPCHKNKFDMQGESLGPRVRGNCSFAPPCSCRTHCQAMHHRFSQANLQVCTGCVLITPGPGCSNHLDMPRSTTSGASSACTCGPMASIEPLCCRRLGRTTRDGQLSVQPCSVAGCTASEAQAGITTSGHGHSEPCLAPTTANGALTCVGAATAAKPAGSLSEAKTRVKNQALPHVPMGLDSRTFAHMRTNSTTTSCAQAHVMRADTHHAWHDMMSMVKCSVTCPEQSESKLTHS